jgi:F0F1-type ATP synthase epsilon subunit
MAKTFYLKISSAEQTLFEGDAQSLSSQNASGPFDILPDHSSFVCLLDNVAVDYLDAQAQSKQVHVHRGLVSVKANKVRVFVDL